MDGDTIFVRGIPIATWEVVQFEQKFGGMLFDESVFSTMDKKIACANVIVQLDKQLRLYFEKNRTRALPDAVDIGDPSWIYIPVAFMPPDDTTIMTPFTTEKPAGLVGWFRTKRFYLVKKPLLH